MKRRVVSGIMLPLLLASFLMLTSRTQTLEGSGTIYSRAPENTFPDIPFAPWGDWTHYHNYTEIVDTLLYLNSTFPYIVDLFSIGRSWEDRDIYCVRLTNESNTHPKPKVFFVGYHHARELISAELPLYFVLHAAIGYGVNTTITCMLDFSEIYVIVALNVDGFDAVEANEWRRKNVHPFDEDEDGLLDEDPPDDEDGDGFIEQKIDGSMEGIDDDGDGVLNEDWVGGVDLNRNYGYQWGAPGTSGSPYPRDQDYRGPTPFSEPETQAIRDWLALHCFKYAVSFHSGLEGIGYPWCYTDTPTPDDELLREVAGDLSDLVNAPYTQGGLLEKNSGVWVDWMYGNRSTFALTCEIFQNDSAWQWEGEWRKGVLKYFNPEPAQIETVVLRWLPVFTNITNRAISEAYDIATISLNPNKTIVGQGYSADIYLTITNHGEFSETFNVTAYADLEASTLGDEIIVGELTVTSLLSGETRIILFTWNTTSATLRSIYTLSAVADTIQGEMHTINNTVVDSTALVTIAGDVDGDLEVDASDLLVLNIVYGSDPSKTNWNSNCDLNNDYKVDAVDLFIFGRNFGKTA